MNLNHSWVHWCIITPNVRVCESLVSFSELQLPAVWGLLVFIVLLELSLHSCLSFILVTFGFQLVFEF